MRVQTACAGYLIVADPAAPGWTATLDGRRVPLGEYDGAMRAVAVPAGESLVEFSYRPLSVMVGAGLSATGFLACVVALWVGRQRKARNDLSA